MKSKLKIRPLMLALGLTTACLATSCEPAPTPADGKPGQPIAGPGGSTYAYTGVTQLTFTSNGVNSYIFQPSPMVGDQALPCISFQHGYSNQLSQNVGFINHLVKKGYIVIYNEFQPSLITLPGSYEANAAANIRAGIAYIASQPSTCIPIATDGNGAKQFGLMGYSVGGVTTVNLAANYVADGLPKPKFVYTMEANNGGLAPMRDASTIPADTYVVMTDAQDDDNNTYTKSSTIWNQLVQIPAARKQWIGVYSDVNPQNSAARLVADHASPLSDAPDALDYNGYFKWGTAVANYTFYGTDYAYWWGNAPDETFMGTWSGGVAVHPAAGSQQAFWPGH